MASRRQHRQDSSSTSPSSPSASIDSSSSSLDSCQGHLTNSNAPSRVGSQYQEGGVGELKLLPEETIKGDYQVTYICPFSNPSPIRGTLTITNYRLYFRPQQSEKPVIIDVPLGFVSRVEKDGGARTPGDNYGLTIICRDMRNLSFALNKVDGHPRKDIYDCLTFNSFPLSHESVLFCYIYREPYPSHLPGWNVYDPVQELKRLGLSQGQGQAGSDIPWRISRDNEKFSVCDTYPAILGLPSQVTNDDLMEVAKFRSKGRVPALCWLHPQTSASITRCSQPLVGLSGRTCQADERLLQTIMDANPQSHKIYIYDARPKVNAVANMARGGGYENEDHYHSAELVFLDIHNIHVMRESLRKVKDMCFPHIEDQRWLSNLEATNWLDHIKQILSGAVKIADKVSVHRTSCVVHCSDGWDRTSQLTSLSMLLLDSHYRTLTGFMVLIEKEWLSFGHKFSNRIGHGDDRHNDSERSPVFLQFIDCVWQVSQQFPNAFEFNEYFLTTILDHLYSCLFGTFLFNSEKERRDNKLSTRSQSLWSFINSKRAVFLNPMYCGVLDNTKALFPVASIRYIKFWKGYYCRWNPRMRPQDSVHLRHAQLLSLRDQLQSKVDSLNQELEGKRAKEVSSGPGGSRRPGGGQGGLVASVTGRLESINI